MVTSEAQVRAPNGRPALVPRSTAALSSVARRQRAWPARAESGSKTALSELEETDELGACGFMLLYDLTGRAVKRSHQPPPSGSSYWTPDDIRDVAHDFWLMDGARHRRLLDGCREASTQPALTALIVASLRNFLIDRARQSPTGPLARSLLNLLATDPTFSRVAGRTAAWTLRDRRRTHVWSGDPEALASSVRVCLGQLPAGRTALLCEVSHRTLGVADAAMCIADLIAVIRRVTPLLVRSTEIAVGESPTERRAPSDTDAYVSARANEIWHHLPIRDRQILPWLGEPVRTWGAKVGLAKSAAASSQTRLRRRLRVALADELDAARVAARLIELASSGTSS